MSAFKILNIGFSNILMTSRVVTIIQRLGLHRLADETRQAVATGLETIRHQNQQQIRRVVGHQAQAHGSKFKVHNSFFP